MIPIILMIIIAVIIIVVIDKPWDGLDFVGDVMFGIGIGGIFSAIYLGIQLKTNIVEPIEQPVQSEYLVNIVDTSYSDTHGIIHGGMVYVYGSISTDNKQVFNYYVKQADGSFKLKSAPASSSVIVYTNDLPRVETYSYECERGTAIFEAWSVASCEKKSMEYRFYVPEGSITSSYKLGG